MYKSKKPMKKETTKKTTMKSKKLTDKQMKQLETHSKKHKGGMNSKHMKNMVKFMKNGDSFIVAHNKSVKLDKK
jgi:gamma-glutamyl phosphate reductase